MARAKRTARVYAAFVALAMAGAGAAAGCAPRIDNHGFLPDKEVIAEIQPGKSDRRQVTEKLGTPLAVGTFDKEVWYYIGKRTETTAFFNPEVLEHKVLIVSFDKQGVVDKVQQVDATKAQDVDIVSRETPTKGRELTILQQMLGNLGRFNAPPEGGGS